MKILKSTKKGLITLGKVRICVVDDHTILRQTLVKALNQEYDMEVISSWDNAEDCIMSIGDEQADVFIMDMKLPGMNGIDAVKRIKSRSPESQIIILSAFTDDKHVFGAIEAGATGYLPKVVTIESLVEAVRTVSRGGAAIDPSVTRKVLSRFSDMYDQSRKEMVFSETENTIITLLSEGFKNKEIADQTGLSERQVRSSLMDIEKKMGAKDRTHIVALAFKTGLLKSDE